MKKIIFLVLTLAIPVAIFLFLKIFGNNEFEVPYLFETGIPGCENATKPHEVPIDELQGISAEALDGFLIFGMLDQQDKDRQLNQIIQLVRIEDAFYEINASKIILLTEDENDINSTKQVLEKEGLKQENYQLVYLPHGEMMNFLKCGIGMISQESDPKTNLVLVDPTRKIRGIYNGLDAEQTEQLILELKILRKQA